MTPEECDHEEICAELRSIDTALGAIKDNSLSFRDKCAIAAMQTLLHNTADNMRYSVVDCAKDAFDYADAMESERQKRIAK